MQGRYRIFPVPRAFAAALLVLSAAPAQADDLSSAGCTVEELADLQGLSSRTAEAIADALPDAEIVEAGEAEDLGEILEKAAAGSAVLGIAGGDGSVNAAAEVAPELANPRLTASLLLTGDAELQRLNREWRERQRNRERDVIAARA